jgi:hypothetical protein
MTLSMYQASAPVFVRGFGNLTAILDKAAKWSEDKKIDQSVLVNARLAADMFPLSRQVQIASDGAKGCVARLAGIDVPSFPDNEANFADLQARIKKTVDFIQTVKPQQIDGSEDKAISLKAGPRELSFKGQAYLTNFVLPNFYFHITTTYAILRHNGLDVGKMDYLGSL